MEENLVWLIHNYPVLVYGIIVFIAFVEGPILSIACGVLLKLGVFPLWPIFWTLVIGDLIGDIAWYKIGQTYGLRFATRYGKYFSIDDSHIAMVKDKFHTYKNSVLIISKLTTGFGFATVVLFTAGLVGIPFRRYLLINSLGQLVWTTMLLSAGYFLSHLYATFDSIFAHASMSVLIVLVVAAIIGYGRYIRSRLEA